MVLVRFARILLAALRLMALAALEQMRPSSSPSRLPGKVRDTLERLGPTFIKFGQALSLRPDFLPDAYVFALRDLQDNASPFASAEAVSQIESAFGRKVDEIFGEFDLRPIAAASIAQVHAAKTKDGCPVIVKVRRPGMRAQIDRDMRALQLTARITAVLVPRLRRHRPVQIVNEIWKNLRKESDFRQEARNIEKFAEAFKDWPTIAIPRVVGGLAAESVLVQERSGGHAIDNPDVRNDGPRLAQVFVDAYLHQFFVLGFFHGDPHPGNLFITKDKRICFHDFGLVGFLDRTTRRNLALFVQSFLAQDAGWVLDAATDLGVLGGDLNRQEFTRAIDEILADFAALPIKEWSLAEALLRIIRLGDGENVRVPHNLIVLMRATFLSEHVLRTLDPDMNVIDALMTRGEKMLTEALREGVSSSAMTRLRSEAAVTAQDLPTLFASWLHRTTRAGSGPMLTVKHEGLESLERHVDRSGNRVALALVTLGLYVAASLLMQHSIGPRLFGDMPLLAAIGYALALWLSVRLINSIRRSGWL